MVIQTKKASKNNETKSKSKKSKLILTQQKHGCSFESCLKFLNLFFLISRLQSGIEFAVLLWYLLSASCIIFNKYSSCT